MLEVLHVRHVDGQMLNKKRWRKLKRNEHRYISIRGKPVIYKPKNYGRWKSDKVFKSGVWEFEHIDIPPPKAFFRYSAFKLWTVFGDESYYPQLELKAFIFSNTLLDMSKTKVKLNEMISKIKNNRYFKNQFKVEVTRRRIAYEQEEVSGEEMQKNHVTITMNASENRVKHGFPITIFI